MNNSQAVFSDISKVLDIDFFMTNMGLTSDNPIYEYNTAKEFYGVEYLYYGGTEMENLCFKYANTGDMYYPTLIYCHENDTYYFTDYDNFVYKCLPEIIPNFDINQLIYR